MQATNIIFLIFICLLSYKIYIDNIALKNENDILKVQVYNLEEYKRDITYTLNIINNELIQIKKSQSQDTLPSILNGIFDKQLNFNMNDIVPEQPNTNIELNIQTPGPSQLLDPFPTEEF